MCMSEAAPSATREWLARLALNARRVLEGGSVDRETLETLLSAIAAAFALIEARRGRSWLSAGAAEALNRGVYEPLLAELARLYGREAALLIEARLYLEEGDVEAARARLLEALTLLERYAGLPGAR